MPDSADNRTKKRILGDIGENIACKFLIKRGFKVIERNYLRKYGEIDIIATKDRVLRFVEVKSVKDRGNVIHETRNNVIRGTSSNDRYRPEDNMHPQKLQKLYRTIQTYLVEKGSDQDWQIDLVTVKIDGNTHTACVEIIENVTL
jgi:putative endonuclease